MAGQRIGYVRVTTLDQNEKRQLDCQVLDRVFTDKASGKGHRQTALASSCRIQDRTAYTTGRSILP